MKYEQFYRQRIQDMPAPNSSGEVAIPCLFHKDSSPSLSINLESGKWKCFASHCPGHKGGGYKLFDKMLNGEVVGTPGTTKLIDPVAVEGFHQVLLQSAKMLDLLKTKRGLTMETITKHKLGFDSDRVWIPIYDAEGGIVNVRKYKPGAKKDKMVPYAAGYNKARLFPMEALDSDWIVLTEGEMDCLVLRQYGFPGLTTTGGADTWLAEFTPLFKGKRVFICFDEDDAGKKGAASVARKLASVASEVRIVHLGLRGTSDEKDITNYFVDLGHTREDFDALLASAEKIEHVVEVVGPPPEVSRIHLSEIGQDVHVGKRVRSTVLIAGKDLAPFQVPYKVGFHCEMGEKQCGRCGIAATGGTLDVTIPEWSPDLLAMVNVHQLTVDKVIAGLAKVPHPCTKYKATVKEFANIEAVKAIPEIDFASERSEYVIRQLFYLGHGLETNHTYDIDAVVMPEPKTQYATAVIYDAKSSQDSLEKFELDADTMQLLSIFKV